MVFVANSFSLGMLPTNRTFSVNVSPALHPGRVAEALAMCEDWLSVVGHADTAAVMSDQLGLDVAHNRASAHLQPGDIVFVAQLTGGRLPEGVTLVWRRVEIALAGREYEII